MKKILLAFVLFPLLSVGQIPDYFADNPQWLQNSICNWNDCIESENYVYYVNGDSLVNTVPYKKIYRHGHFFSYPFSGQGNWCPQPYDFIEFVTLLRQDGRKIYTYDDVWGDTLMYNFDLQIGNSLPVTFIQWESGIVIDSVDSILINGSYRKQFFWSSGTSIMTNDMIEGIGAMSGFLEPMNTIFECGHSMNCYEVNDVTYVGTNCNFDVGADEIENAPKIELFPIPANERLTIHSENTIESIQIQSLTGEIQKIEWKKTTASEYSLNISGISSGIYLVQVQLDGDFTVCKKISVNQ